jgi:hypothetical protein
MNTSAQIGPVSTEHLLTCLDLAIDEAKQTRSLIQSKDLPKILKEEGLLSDTLSHLDHEIGYLEIKITQVRSLASLD